MYARAEAACSALHTREFWGKTVIFCQLSKIVTQYGWLPTFFFSFFFFSPEKRIVKNCHSVRLLWGTKKNGLSKIVIQYGCSGARKKKDCQKLSFSTDALGREKKRIVKNCHSVRMLWGAKKKGLSKIVIQYGCSGARKKKDCQKLSFSTVKVDLVFVLKTVTWYFRTGAQKRKC